MRILPDTSTLRRTLTHTATAQASPYWRADVTEKQGEQIAARIVAAARAAGRESPTTWTRVEIPITALGFPEAEAIAVLDTNLALLCGLLPLGWRLSSEQGARELTVLRSC
jgi:hypothetical protein